MHAKILLTHPWSPPLHDIHVLTSFKLTPIREFLSDAPFSNLVSERCALPTNCACASGYELKQKCQRSKVAWRHWRNAGRPRSGPLYQNMKAAKYEVKLYVRKCRARQERKVIQTRDEMFKNKDDHRFNIHQKRSHCRKLIVDGKSVTEEDNLLKCWKDYFSNLAQTQAGNSDLSDLDISHIEAMSHWFEDLILDTPFTTEEVEKCSEEAKDQEKWWCRWSASRTSQTWWSSSYWMAKAYHKYNHQPRKDSSKS